MYYADIKEVDIQDGEGIRVSLYVSGCHFHCKGCHNKETWDFNYGKEFTDETVEKIINLLDKDYITGLSLLGGEPLEPINQKGLVKLVKEVKQRFPEKTIWCWTGYDFEKDIFGKMYKEFSFTKDLLSNIDIIVDGQFEEENKLVDLKFRGSTNQKKIDVQASIKNDSVVTLKFGDENRYINKKPKIITIQEFKNKENNNYFGNIQGATDEFNYNNNESIETITIQKPIEKISAKSEENISEESLN